MPSSPADRLLSSSFLGRVGLALILLFVVNSLFGLLPLQLLDPGWQLRVADLLRTTAPFTLLGAALIYLCEGPARGPSPPLFPLRRIQRMAPWAALGFALLIPLLIHASYLLIRNADVEAQKTIRSVERRTASVRSVANDADLLRLSQGLPPDWQPLAGASLNSNRARLLARVEPELARLRTMASSNKNAAIQKTLRDDLRDVLLSLIYAVAFFGLRPTRFAPLPLSQIGFDEPQADLQDPADPQAQARTAGAEASPLPNQDDPEPPGEEPDLSQGDHHPWYP